MSANYIEDLVSEHYRIRGYMVMKNYWFRFTQKVNRTQRGKEQKAFQQGAWSDIDVLALSENHLDIVQVKAWINSQETSEIVITGFDRVMKYLTKGIGPDGKSSIKWLSNNKRIRKIIVHEWDVPPKYKIQLENQGISVVSFENILTDLVGYIEDSVGTKEENPTLRMLHYLCHAEWFVNHEEGQS